MTRHTLGSSSTVLAVGALAAASVLTLAQTASAQLDAAFESTITVESDWFTGANGATDIAFAADGRAVVTLKNGTILVRRTDGTRNMVTGQFGTVDTGSEKGLLGVVAHPDVATNNTFFFYVSNGSDSNDKHRVYTGVLDASDTVAVDMDNPIIAASRNLGPGLRGPANHDGGGMVIHNGMLYVGVGDTGSNATPPTNKLSSCLNLPNGKILRVNLDGTIPSSNPLVGETMVTACDSPGGAWTTAAPDERIFAWGFRNPWRLWVDPMTELLWIGDVGETTREEISVGGGDQHYGYPFFEGTTDWSMMGGGLRLDKDCTEEFLPPRACTPPVTDHARGMGGSVTGGLIPSGCGWSNAFGGRTLYVYGDFAQDFIRALEVNAARDGVMSSTPVPFGNFDGGVVSFRMGPDEALYAVFYGGGSVYRMVPTDRTGTDCMGGGGAGGAGGGGAGGASGAGGAAGSGGAAMGGTPGAGSGGSPAGGADMGGADMGGADMGGTPGTGGSGVSGAAPTGGAATGGAAGSTAAGAGGTAPASEDDGGCGCRVGSRSSGLYALAIAALGMTLAFGRRLRRRS